MILEASGIERRGLVDDPQFAGGVGIVDDLVVGLSADGLVMTNLKNNGKSFRVDALNRNAIAAFLVGRQWLAIATKSLLLETWTYDIDFKKVKTEAIVKAHKGGIRALCSDKSNLMIATASADRTAKVFDRRRKLACTHIFRHDAVVTMVKLSFSQKSNVLATANENFCLSIFDLTDKTKRWTYDNHQARIVHLSICIDFAEVFLATVSDDDKLRVFDAKLKICQDYNLNTSTNEDTLLVATSNGEQLILSDGKVLKLFEFKEKTFTCLRTASIEAPISHLLDLRFDTFFYGVTFDGLLEKYDLSTLRQDSDQPSLYIGQEEIIDCAYTSSNSFAVAGSTSDSVKILDADTMVSISVLRGHTDIVLALALHKDTLVTGSKDTTCRVWDLHSAECISTCHGHTAPVSAVCFVHENYIASAGRDNTVKLWSFDASTKSVTSKGSVAAHEKDINAIACNLNQAALFSSQLILASASHDKTIKLWPLLLQKGKSIHLTDEDIVLRGHRRGVWQLAFHPSRALLASCSSDKTIRLWHLKRATCLGVLDGHESPVLSLVFYGDQSLISGGADGILKVWTLNDMKLTKTQSSINAHDEARVWSLCRTHDGIASAGADGRLIRFRDVTAEHLVKERQLKQEERQQEQALRDALRTQDWQKALTDAFDLDRPYTAFQVLKRASASSQQLDALFTDWPLTRAQRCLQFIREWNTDATKAFIAQTVLSSLIRRFGHSTLFAQDRALPEAIAAYTRRHIKRIDSLHKATFLLDHTLGAMQRDLIQVDTNKKYTNNLPTIYPDDTDLADEDDRSSTWDSLDSDSSDDDEPPKSNEALQEITSDQLKHKRKNADSSSSLIEKTKRNKKG